VADTNLMYSWGSAQSGRLGTGARVNQLIPDIVDELSQPELNVLAISCGLDHVLALAERE
jgi:alpha-tubulin suppressor-like RCC1 family protein